MNKEEQKLQSRSIAAFLCLKEMLERCEDCRTKYELRYVQAAFNELYDDWLAHVEPAEEQP